MIFPSAAIDVGSNAIRLAIGEVDENARIQMRASIREPVRLGQDVFTDGRLSDECLDRAVAAFKKFRKLIDLNKAQEIRAVGTSALREAANRDLLIERVKQAADINIEVISPSEEALLVYLAVANKISLKSTHALLVDIGGGSVEVSLTANGVIASSRSLKLGTVRMLRFLDGNKTDQERFEILVKASIESIEEWLNKYLNGGKITKFVGTGGNVEALAEVARKHFGNRGEDSIPADVFTSMVSDMKDMRPDRRKKSFSLRSDRADVILPAALVLQALMNLVKAKEIMVPGVGLKEGLLLEMTTLRKHKQQEVYKGLLTAARQLNTKYKGEDDHSENTYRFAHQLFYDLQHVHRLDDRSELLLSMAAILHDIGRFISVTDHHKHTFYLLQNEPIEGLTERERLIVANVARYHRKARPSVDHEGFASLLPKDRTLVMKLSALLRLADGLDAHLSGHVGKFATHVTDRQLTVKLYGDSQLVIEDWLLNQKAELFQDVFGMKFKVEIQTYANVS